MFAANICWSKSWSVPSLHHNTRHVQQLKIFYGKNIFFPDFCKVRTIPEMLIQLFDSLNYRYDVIIGRDLLTHGFVLDHVRNIITWDGLSITMTKTSDNIPSINTSFSWSLKTAEAYATASTKILHAKYEHFSPEDIVKNCSHLNRNNQAQLLQLLSKFPPIFSHLLQSLSYPLKSWKGFS